MENANALGLDFEHNNSSSRTDNAGGTDDSDESDDGIAVHLESPASPIPEARKQRLLNELEVQFQFNETMKSKTIYTLYTVCTL